MHAPRTAQTWYRLVAESYRLAALCFLPLGGLFMALGIIIVAMVLFNYVLSPLPSIILSLLLMLLWLYLYLITLHRAQHYIHEQPVHIFQSISHASKRYHRALGISALIIAACFGIFIFCTLLLLLLGFISLYPPLILLLICLTLVYLLSYFLIPIVATSDATISQSIIISARLGLYYWWRLILVSLGVNIIFTLLYGSILFIIYLVASNIGLPNIVFYLILSLVSTIACIHLCSILLVSSLLLLRDCKLHAADDYFFDH